LEYRDYFNLSVEVPRHMIAFWTFSNITTSGKLPYMTLPAIGWDPMGRSGRGYPQGRLRGENLYYAELEYRVPIRLIPKKADLLGAVLFANMTSATAKDREVELFEYWKPGVGLGLRIMMQKESRANLTIDYGWGAEGSRGLFLNLNEYF
jgi:hypothetical protein